VKVTRLRVPEPELLLDEPLDEELPDDDEEGRLLEPLPDPLPLPELLPPPLPEPKLALPEPPLLPPPPELPDPPDPLDPCEPTPPELPDDPLALPKNASISGPTDCSSGSKPLARRPRSFRRRFFLDIAYLLIDSTVRLLPQHVSTLPMTPIPAICSLGRETGK
jgi:hypothetical protein